MALSTLNSLVDNHHIKCSICLGTFKGPNLISVILVSRKAFSDVVTPVLLAELG